MSQDVDRYLMALPRGEDGVFLAWRLLEGDRPDVGFEVERRAPGGPWQVVSDGPIVDSTNFLDRTPNGEMYEYRVAGLKGSGREASASVSVDSGATATMRAIDAPHFSERPDRGGRLAHRAGAACGP